MKTLLKLFGIDIELARKFAEWKRKQMIDAFERKDWNTAYYIENIKPR